VPQTTTTEQHRRSSGAHSRHDPAGVAEVRPEDHAMAALPVYATPLTRAGSHTTLVDATVHRHGPLDFAGSVGPCQQRCQHLVPGAVTGVAAMPLPHRLPGSELLSGQIAPGDPSPVPEDDPLDHAAVVAERMTTPPHVGRQQRADQLPPWAEELAVAFVRLLSSPIPAG
jgi:hypothetical protein